MNKRIIELAEQAGYSKDFLAVGLPSNMEKFAELIIEECIHIVEDAGGVDKYHYSEAIEKNFGEQQ